MPVTMADVRRALDPDEVDYDTASQLGPEALSHLKALVEAGDPGLAAKAAYLAGRIQDGGSEEVVAVAAASGDARVRVAAASAASMLAPEAASRVLADLVLDGDTGVQKHALRSVPTEASSDLRDNLERLAQSGSDVALRDMISDALGRVT